MSQPMSDVPLQTAAPPQPGPAEEITVGKTVTFTESGTEVPVFTMTLGGETISLLP